jgi:uncharacterized protein with NAD-binding domain and iron-sulfur cluster
MAKTKIAILGGGIGSLAAAFDITEQDPDGSLFEVTIYQVGWRLGGKCAVGWSGGSPNVRYEHGLHVWAGFYDNAFDLIQRCYDAMSPPPFADWSDAFYPIDDFWVEDDDDGGGLRAWRLHAVPNGLVPGVGDVKSPDQLWMALLNLVSNAFYSSALEAIASRAAPLAVEAAAARTPERARVARARLRGDEFALRPDARDALLNLLAAAHDGLSEADAIGAPPADQHIAVLINLGLALLLGMLDGNVLSDGFDGLDGEEWTAWMRAYGAWDLTLNSAVVAGFYDYVFGTPNDVRNVGAGAGTRALLRLLFAYKGSFFYAPQQTFGEILIAPLYKVLLARNVTFKFFHRVDRLKLSADLRYVDEIDIGIQAYPVATAYDPLISVGGLASWPNNPVYNRIQRGAELEASDADLESPWDKRWPDAAPAVLKRGTHFDVVVLGVSVGALKTICADLGRALPAWSDMLATVQTTATMAMQLWLTSSVEAYGWWPSPPTLVSALPPRAAAPLTTWGDNSQLIDQEQWPAAKPASLAYFVGNFPDLNATPAEQQAAAESGAKAWRLSVLPKIWKGYDESQIAKTYVRANINPSDRYVLSAPKTVDARLAPDGSGVKNLFLAGDWVRIGLNAGCVEQAVLGGRAAARAITGVDMNSQYDGDFSGQAGSVASSVRTLGLFSLLPDLRRTGDAGAGSADACCVVAYAKRDWIEKLLPLGLKLGRITLGTPFPADSPYYPIALMFARQSFVRPGFAPRLGGLSYNELLFIIPSVIHAERQPFPYRGPFAYMSTILLDSLPPQLIGTEFYGLKKRLARIRAYPDSFDIRFDEGEISASFANVKLPGQIQDFPVLATVRKYLEQVIIGETSIGAWVYSYIENNLDAAEFQAISGTIRGTGKRQFQFDFFPIEPTGTTAKVPEKDKDGNLIPSPVGFRLLTDWTITYPIVHGRYDAAPKPAPVRAFASAMAERLFPGLGRFPFR